MRAGLWWSEREGGRDGERNRERKIRKKEWVIVRSDQNGLTVCSLIQLSISIFPTQIAVYNRTSYNNYAFAVIITITSDYSQFQ